MSLQTLGDYPESVTHLNKLLDIFVERDVLKLIRHKNLRPGEMGISCMDIPKNCKLPDLDNYQEA